MSDTGVVIFIVIHTDEPISARQADHAVDACLDALPWERYHYAAVRPAGTLDEDQIRGLKGDTRA